MRLSLPRQPSNQSWSKAELKSTNSVATGELLEESAKLRSSSLAMDRRSEMATTDSITQEKKSAEFVRILLSSLSASPLELLFFLARTKHSLLLIQAVMAVIGEVNSKTLSFPLFSTFSLLGFRKKEKRSGLCSRLSRPSCSRPTNCLILKFFRLWTKLSPFIM